MRQSVAPKVLAFLFLGTVLLDVCRAKVVSGEMVLDTEYPYQFLSKFCFVNPLVADDTGAKHWGEVELFDIEPKDSGVTISALQDGTVHSMRAQSAMPSCYNLSHTELSVQVGGSYSSATRIGFATHTRPRFFYLFASHCGLTKPISFRYKVTWNNGGGWERQFGFDKRGLLEIHLAASIGFTIVLVLSLAALTSWREHHGFAPSPVSLVCIAAGFAVGYHFFRTVSLAHYAWVGHLSPLAEIVSHITECLSWLALLLLLVIVAHGWSFKIERLRPGFAGRGVLVTVCCALAFGQFVLVIYSLFFLPRISTLYLYDSVPGYIILAIRMGILGWLLDTVRKSYQDEYQLERRPFYIKFAVATVIFFIHLPVVVGISVFLDPWVRAKAVAAINAGVDLLFLGGLTFILWPSRAVTIFKVAGPNSYENDKYSDQL